MATQHVERNLLNLYREENILLVCFFLPLKSDKNVWHLQPSFSTWRPLAFLPVTFSEGDLGSVPGLGRSPGEGKGYPLQYSGLENSMDCTVHGVAKSQTRLSNLHSSMPLLIPVILILMLLMIAPCIINCLTHFISAQVNKLQHVVPVQQGYIKLHPTMESITHP